MPVETTSLSVTANEFGVVVLVEIFVERHLYLDVYSNSFSTAP